MKKILLFLFALFSFYPTINASEYVMTEISFNAHAQNKNSSQEIIGISKIYNQAYELRNSKGEIVDILNHTGFHGGIKYDEYDLIETRPALGYYTNKPFKYHFAISKECPRIRFDITKNYINEDVVIHFKDGLKHNVWIQDSNYKIIYNERKLTNDININLVYDIYKINVDGTIIYTFDMTNFSYRKNNNLFSNDSLSIEVLPNSYYDGYEPETYITTTCFNENNELIGDTKKYVWKDEGTNNEEIISNSQSNDIHNENTLIIETDENLEIKDTNLQTKISNEILESNPIEECKDIPIEETKQNLNIEVEKQDYLLKNQTEYIYNEESIIKKENKVIKKELNYTPILGKLDNIEENEDNLIIKKIDVKKSYNPKVVQRNSLWPFLIIVLLLPIFIKLFHKIIKKVQK